jgi:putative ABC transport system ATP-binding protein
MKADVAPAPLIRVEGLHKHYETDAGPQPVLRGVDLNIGAGEFIAVMGASGSGKSTFMNILGCLDVPSAGRYLLEGHDTSRMSPDQLAHLRNRFIGFVFQGFNLLPRATLLDNVALPMLYAASPARERIARGRELLARVGLEGYADYLPSRISGGQQQRVAIARAIVTDPAVIVADEPTGDLDRNSADEILTILQLLNKELGKTIVMVTHDPAAANYAKRVLHLDKGRFVERELAA